MELILQRTHEVNNTTLGKLSIGDNFYCYTLEDKVRDKKIKHETAIPAGRYKIIISFSQKFQTLMPRLLKVPEFEGILIHPGNYADNETFLKDSPINKNVLTMEKIRLKVI